MNIHDLPKPEKFDLDAYELLNQFNDKMRDTPSLAALVASCESERPTVLAASIYDSILGDGVSESMMLVKLNDEIYEFGLCGFVPYKPFLKTDDTSVKSVWSCIAVFTDKSRKAGARTLMIRAGLPKP